MGRVRFPYNLWFPRDYKDSSATHSKALAQVDMYETLLFTVSSLKCSREMPQMREQKLRQSAVVPGELGREPRAGFAQS